MSVSPGTKLGPYEILSPLGAGGMGEVYRARDTRLDRTVAIKILPAHFSNDPVRKQRFAREAKAISGLNHPNICTLHDVGSQDGTDYLVMEYVEGESLAQRLAKGPLPVEQVLKVGGEMADALDRAHRSGIIHRDLKPGNIMLAKSGAKLLDFGLARPASPTTSVATLTASAAQQTPVTQDGTIVGTFQYMSPEQVEGKELDARSDIFSLGAVLYEIVTGQRAFEGKSQLSVASAILEKEPAPIITLKPLSPRSLDHVIRRCLAKDPDDRWQTARDVALELNSIVQGDSVTESAEGAATKRWGSLRERLVWGIASVLLLITAYSLLRPHTSSVLQLPALRTSILPPDKHRIGWSDAGVLSPDGRFLVFSALGPEPGSQLWLRPLDSITARQLPGTEGASNAFWSPDSQWIAFFSGGKLKKTSVEGGTPLVICNGPSGRGGSWGPDGTILFVPGFGIPVYSVPATGGTPSPVTQLDKSLSELTHRWPAFLPDGKHFLFFSRASQNATYVGTLGSAERKLILKNDSNAIYVPPGYLLFVRNGDLMAQPFDAQRMEFSGTALPIAENVPTEGITQHGLFSASNNGIVSTQPKFGKLLQPVWVDRSGKVLEVLGEPAMYVDIAVAPDGQKTAFVITDPQDGSWNTWILDLRGHQKSRLTFESSVGYYPVWSPNGNEIIFGTNRLGVAKIFSIPASGLGQARLFLPSDDSDIPSSWSRDGRYIAFLRNPSGDQNERNLWILPTFGDKKPYRLIESIGTVGEAVFSPDGKWLAYHSNETGHQEVYVVPFPEANRKIPVSSGGGSTPRWAPNGKELYYLGNDGTLISASIQIDKSELQVSNTQPLFKTSRMLFDISPDGKRFLVYKEAEDQPTSAITLITNWSKALQK
jgi:serine/threonine protein kinase